MGILILNILAQSEFHQFDHDKMLNSPEQYSELEKTPIASLSSNYDSIGEIMDAKVNDYNSLGYFPQVYQISLQATYYALYVLNAIGRLSSINQLVIINYIMSNFNPSSNMFLDDYSRRYMDINISKTFYPQTSLLEVNCYAILSLNILGRLDLIDVQDSISFLWSCYNPVTSGFIGQPYNFILPAHFKLSTLDNTYFAIKTLDLLMTSWNGFLSEKNDLINYIDSLQSTDAFFWYFGGFMNDEDFSLDTLSMFEPNLLSAFYTVASLDIFNAIDAINDVNFHQYLGGLHDSQEGSFQMAYFLPRQNYGNLVATSLGLTLSDLTNYNGMIRGDVIDFVLDNRNSKGIWNYSTNYIYCELIDTFQVIRSLTESGEISRLSETEKDDIANSLSEFLSVEGYSLLSKDYTSINLLNSLINAFDLYDRLPELDAQYLYSLIEESLYHYAATDNEGFLAGLIFDKNYLGYRSYPLEYYLSGNQEYLQQPDRLLVSHESTYKALNCIDKLSKLGELSGAHDLTELLYSILDSQFLEAGYDNQGAFLPFLTFLLTPSSYQNEKIFIEYSYYAIRIMELLSGFLGLGGINSLDFSQSALSSYVHGKMHEDPSYIYFNPGYECQPSRLIENTYHASYILNALGYFDLNEQKIENFVMDSINYSDIRSIHFSFKLRELLSLDVSFNNDLIYELIGTIYSEELHEYYLSIKKSNIDHEVLSWVAEMVENELKYSSISIEIISLQDCDFLSVGNNITFSIDSTYGGNYYLEIDETLVESDSFSLGWNGFTYSLDGNTDELGEHFVFINATTIEGNEAFFSSSFFVYSSSETMVEIHRLDNYELMTTGNMITFRLSSNFPDWFNFSIEGEEIDSGSFYDGQLLSYFIDGYDMGDHDVMVFARGLDQKEGFASGTFTVYSTSETIITLHSIENYQFNSTGNLINFSISSNFPEWYEVRIDGVLLQEGPYLSDEIILCSIDGYGAGLHDLYIWANSTDKKESLMMVQFSVFTESFIEIEIRHLDNYEFRTTGNYIEFFINTSFPDMYEFSIDGFLISSDLYNQSGHLFNFSIDHYFLGEHNISIWANSTDGKEAACETSFTVYSLSTTIVNIQELSNHEFQTTGNFVKFNISSLYPDQYKIFIDGIEVDADVYESGTSYYFSIDGNDIGLHFLRIWANSSDKNEAACESSFTVYSLSNTIVYIEDLPDHEFQTIGNFVKFNISSLYPDQYKIFINDIEVYTDVYDSGAVYYFNIDGYGIGLHSLLIWAIGEDGKIGTANGDFNVYSISINSTTVINVNGISSHEFLTTGNYINFSINSQYLGTFNVSIDGSSVESGNYTIDEEITCSIDGYSIGDHVVTITATSIDGKNALYETIFSVFSLSSTLITIHEISDYLLNSTGNYINFSIYSKYPDYYTLRIDDLLINSSKFVSDKAIICSLDNYTSILGNHTIYIRAIGLDQKESELKQVFLVYTDESIDDGTVDDDIIIKKNVPSSSLILVSFLIIIFGTTSVILVFNKYKHLIYKGLTHDSNISLSKKIKLLFKK